jgi:hypothetical protein
MRRHPSARFRLWRFTVWYDHRNRRRFRPPVFWRPVHWLWCHTAPLGCCSECREPTWNPVTFYVQHDIGRSGHYYCERCGPPIREAALLLGERVVERD